MLFFFAGEWEREDKLGSHALRADHVDVLAMGLDDLLDNGKPKTGSLFVFASGEVCLVESIPDFLDAVRRNSDSGILDGN